MLRASVSRWGGSGYSRGLEDQADRVGLRYANEGGYNVGAGVPLWGKVRSRYGESDKVTNFFLGSHSRPTNRSKNIEDEIPRNYRDSPRYVAMSAPEPSPSRPDAEGGSEWVVQVDAQLDSARRELGDEYAPIDEVDADGAMLFELSVKRGVDYLVVGVCDKDCDDVDLLSTTTPTMRLSATSSPTTIRWSRSRRCYRILER